MNTLSVLTQLCGSNDTPAYVFNLDELSQHIGKVKAIIAEYLDAKILFAIKANPFLVKPLEELTDGFEVCSPGEFAICKENKIAPESIVLSGVNKQQGDVEDAVTYGVRVLTVESMGQFRLIRNCAEKTGTQLKLLLRLTSGNQFGLTEEEIREIVHDRKEYPLLLIEGIQYYSGTQKKAKKITEEFQRLMEFCDDLDTEEGFHADVIEYGPGWIVDYFGKEEGDSEMLRECCEAFAKAAAEHRISLEMGRFLSAQCGYYVTKVEDVKKHGDQTYCIVDGGIHHVNYYGNVMGVRVPPVKHYQNTAEGFAEAEKPEGGEEISVCGSLCTVADVLVKALPVKNVEVGDLFVFERIGAYSVTEGIYLFLSRAMPAVFMYQKGNLVKVRDSKDTYPLNM